MLQYLCVCVNIGVAVYFAIFVCMCQHRSGCLCCNICVYVCVNIGVAVYVAIFVCMCQHRSGCLCCNIYVYVSA